MQFSTIAMNLTCGNSTSHLAIRRLSSSCPILSNPDFHVICMTPFTILNYFFGLSQYLTVNRVCVSFKMSTFCLSPYLTVNAPCLNLSVNYSYLGLTSLVTTAARLWLRHSLNRLYIMFTALGLFPSHSTARWNETLTFVSNYSCRLGKGKASPLQAWAGS